MALRHGSSASIGLTDVIGVVRAFEQSNSVRITITGRVVERSGVTDMLWEAKAWEPTDSLSGQSLLACASVTCLERRLVMMEAVVLQLLYALDFQLGERELEKAKSQKA